MHLTSWPHDCFCKKKFKNNSYALEHALVGPSIIGQNGVFPWPFLGGIGCAKHIPLYKQYLSLFQYLVLNVIFSPKRHCLILDGHGFYVTLSVNGIGLDRLR